MSDSQHQVEAECEVIKGAYILVAEDTKAMRRLEVMFLRKIGARVDEAEDGDEALEKLRKAAQDNCPYDLLVSDINMPRVNGLQLLKSIRTDAALKKTPVIIVASRYEEDEHEDAVRAGADDVIEKPINRLTLIQAVNRFLRLAVRGLVRVPLEAEVRLGLQNCQTWGRACNISRGGIFVESIATVAPDTEVQLQFQLPDATDAIAPTAKVVWRRTESTTVRPGLGLQFLKLDRTSAQRLDDYVYERAGSLFEANGGAAPMPVR